MSTFSGSRSSPYRSKAARSGAAIGARLFSPAVPETPRRSEDAQACIRSALRRRRRALGLTQAAAAGVLGMSRLTYHRIESGARNIHFAELAAICAAFNCHVGELVCRTGSSPTPSPMPQRRSSARRPAEGRW
jgi:DNA-binding XRE family transcriptional regulator